jgi:L-alanine-DL-glutamate epimerase-like enolase superfamily enzyme
MTDTTITAIRTTMLRVPWPNTPWLKGHAFGPMREFLVLDVETRGGIAGIGYLFLFRPGMRTIAACLDECVIPRVLGKDASAVEAIWQDLWRFTVTYGRAGIAVMAMSVLDIALWDVLGKAAKLPLHRLWGHYRAQLPAYGSGCFRGSGGDGMIAKALHYKERGYKAIKMQVAHTAALATDLDNVRRMREIVGPDIDSRRHLGHDHRAASVSGTQRPAPCFDSERAVDRGHGARRRYLGRTGAGGEWSHHRAGTAWPRSCLQAGNSARLRGQKLSG